jgi:DNA invertase Pin-like site-specific DNA recombinase
MNIEFFWSRIDIKGDNDCWEWKLYKNKYGYGMTKIDGETIRSHRAIYQLTHPDENIKTKVIRHICDNTSCCNPSHLKSGTQAENIQDMVDRNRNRGAVGSRNCKCKLSEEEVIKIRDLFKNNNLFIIEISRQFNVSTTTIRKILEGISWKKVGNIENLLIGKKHHVYGEKHGSCKIKNETAFEIQELFKKGCKMNMIAQKFNVSVSTIRRHLNVEKRSRNKLNIEQVREIRELSKKIQNGYIIAQKFNVCYGTIRSILRGNSWKC